MELTQYVWHAGNPASRLLPVKLKLVGDAPRVFSIPIPTGMTTPEPGEIKASLRAISGGNVNIGAILT